MLVLAPPTAPHRTAAVGEPL
jgi:hypothetical protein